MSAAEGAPKRDLEETDDVDRPAAKRQRAQAEPAADAPDGADGNGAADADMGDAADAGAAEAAEEPAEEAADAAAAAPKYDEPFKLGYKTFSNPLEANSYIRKVLSRVRADQPLNEYELVLMLDLIQKGHPTADEKLSGGVSSIVVRSVQVGDGASSCFHIQRLDGSYEDFSYRKCLTGMFPGVELPQGRGSDPGHHGGGRGRGGGGFRGGGGGRGRGGGGGGGGGRGGGRGGGFRGRGGGRGRGGRGRG